MPAAAPQASGRTECRPDAAAVPESPDCRPIASNSHPGPDPGGDPAEKIAMLSVRPGFGGIVSPAFQEIVFRHDPGTVETAGHDITGHIAVGILGVNEIPPISDLKDIRTLVSIEQVRGPEILGRFPVL